MNNSYTVLIRTFNSAQTLPVTLRTLAWQSAPPASIVVVDSGSTDETKRVLPASAIWHRYIGEEFNYAEAISQGLEYVTTRFVMIISSHTGLLNPMAAAFAMESLERDRKLGAVYFSDPNVGELRIKLINRSNFNGFNGLWNTCSVIKVDLLRRRGFRREVFSAEDQEWARWLIFEDDKYTGEIAGAGRLAMNPRGASYQKRLNEYIAVAYFTRRSLLAPWNVLRIGLQAVSPKAWRMGPEYRRFYARLSIRLVGCWFGAPKIQSRYF